MFEIVRDDGRSHQQVLIDAVHNAAPGTMFTYEHLQNVLGFPKRERVRSVIIASRKRLLQEFSRTMENVRGKGYRMISASEHARVAKKHERKADKQLLVGLDILRNVRWDEMDEESRKAHQGTLMISEALYRIQSAQQKQLDRHEEAIRKAGFAMK